MLFFFFSFNSHVLCKLAIRFSALSHFKIEKKTKWLLLVEVRFLKM